MKKLGEWLNPSSQGSDFGPSDLHLGFFFWSQSLGKFPESGACAKGGLSC